MIAPDGSLVLLYPAVLPYRPGQSLRVRISPSDETNGARRLGSLMRYEELIGLTPPAVS